MRLLAALAFFLVALGPISAIAKPTIAEEMTSMEAGMVEQFSEIELSKLQIEREKLALERERLKVQTEGAEADRHERKWTRLAIVVPIIGTLFTVAFGFWSTSEQAKQAVKLEVVKSVAQARSPMEAAGRAEFYSKLIPGTINMGKLSPNDVEAATYNDGNSAIQRSKKEFFASLPAETPLDTRLAIWRALFPNDAWPAEPALTAAMSGKSLASGEAP